MADLATSRIPRDQLVSLIADTSDQRERITAPMPAARLDELLAKPEVPEVEDEVIAHGSSPELVVRFKTKSPVVSSRHIIIIWSFTITLLVGALVIILL
jgi:hypothetical protein